jgi:choline-sulfatase
MQKSRIVWLVIVIIVVAMAAVYFLSRGSAPPQYIILVFMDAVRPDHLGCYGYERNTSPHIDALAREGALFEGAVSQAPWTLSSLATVVSSTFPSQHGARRKEGVNVALKGGEGTFVEILAAGGYRTCAMSTAKLYTAALGLVQGFDESYVIGRYNDILEKVAAMELSGAAITWLRRHKDEKCFLVIHHYDTHYPYKASASCINRFDPDYNGEYRLKFGDSSLRILKKARVGRLSEIGLTERDIRHIKALYDCEIVRTDASLGRLIDSLATWDCLDKSMIIITADHGEEFLEHGSVDHGQTVYDESIRVPLVVFAPSCVGAGSRIPDQVGLIDLGPTVLQAAGMAIPAEFEGRSLMPLMSSRFEASGGDLRPCGIPYSYYVAEALAHRPERKALRCPPHKLIIDPFLGTAELYHLGEDPHETVNLAATRPDLVEQMTDILLTAMESYYPGGWGVVWRGGRTRGTIKGSVETEGELIEAVAHNLHPDVDPDIDMLVMSGGRRSISFGSALDTGWEGIELRMAKPAKAGFDIRISGVKDMSVQVGNRLLGTSFPLTLEPAEARVGRRDLGRIFSDTSADLVIFWIDPGSEPGALDKKQEELRKKLKAIGYID